MNQSKLYDFVVVNNAWQKVNLPPSFLLPQNSTLYHLATIVRGKNEYVLLLLQGLQKAKVFLNKIDLSDPSIFVEITDDQEYNELNEFVISQKLNQIYEGRPLGKNWLV